jgi:hypothetical protein
LAHFGHLIDLPAGKGTGLFKTVEQDGQVTRVIGMATPL